MAATYRNMSDHIRLHSESRASGVCVACPRLPSRTRPSGSTETIAEGVWQDWRSVHDHGAERMGGSVSHLPLRYGIEECKIRADDQIGVESRRGDAPGDFPRLEVQATPGARQDR